MDESQEKVIGRDTIPVDAGGDSPQTTKQWFKTMVPYRNYAGHSKELDMEVVRFVDTIKSTFQQRMIGVHQRWAANWATANGEAPSQEREDDVAMPETQKLLNSKVAHMEQALFGIEPILEVEGVREDLGRMKAVVISSYVRRMLELAQHRDYFGPAAKDAQLCNYSAIKVVWNKRFGEVVNTHVEMKMHGATMPAEWEVKKTIGRKVVEDGPRLHLVDPFWLIIDLDAGNTRDISYIGDESMQFVHSLEEQAELGVFPKSQVKKLREKKDASITDQKGLSEGPSLIDQFRQARQIALQTDFVNNAAEPSDRHAARARCVELWAYYNFKDGYDGVVDPTGKRITGTHMVVITIANGIVLQFRLNPFDRKFFPYAVAVMNRSGHELVAPAPFDQVVVMNAQYDRFQSGVLRHMDLSITPFIAAGEDADFSDPSINDFQAGSVLRNLGRDWREVQIKDLPQSVQFFYGFYRREMEELAGKLRVHETTPGTATEVERKLQEQQMLIDRETRVQAEQWRQVALIIYKMAGQFATQAQQFKVIGKAQAVLGKSFQMPPNWLQEEIDVRFLGVDSAQTVGSRSAGITQWMNQWGPLMDRMPQLNLMEMARLQWEQMVGRHNMSAIFPEEDASWMLWPQDEENQLLIQGISVPVSKRDNHEEHLPKAIRALRKAQADPKSSAAVLSALAEHVQEHMDALQRQRMEQEAAMREAEEKAQLQAAGGGGPGVDSAPPSGGMEAPTKQSGVTNGPPQARTVARTGREGAGISQTQAMGQQ